MHRLLSGPARLVLVLLLVGPAQALAANVAVEDDRGRMVVLAQSAGRIVSLAPHVTELLFAAGAGGRLVGVSAFSDYPAAAARLPVVGGAVRIDIERVLRLRPDLVIAWGSGNSVFDIEKLEKLGLKVLVTEPRRLADIPGTLIKIGLLTGDETAARHAADRFNRDLDALRSRYQSRSPVRLFFQIERRPLMTLNSAHIVSDVFDLCGGENVFGALPELAPVIGMEAVIERNPQVIFVSTSIADVRSVVQEWTERKELQAVRTGHVYAIAPELIVRPTPRILQGARLVCEKLDVVRDQ